MAKTYLEEIHHRQAIEDMVDYKRGLRNLKTGTKALSESTGLSPEIAEALLKTFSRDNVTQIRGYSKEPEHLRKSKIGKSNEPKK